VPTQEIVLYRGLASRAIIALWMLEELGVAYRSEMVEGPVVSRSPELLRLNPSGKLPALVDGDVVVSENPAICIYLADRYGYGTLAPRIEDPDRGAWLKWLVYSTAVLEPARELQASRIVAPRNGWGVGWPALDVVVRELVGALQGRDFLLGDRFTAADIPLGATISIGLFCELLPREPVLVAYSDRLNARPAWRRASALNWPAEVDG
jgi:glutathione S-transferase